MSKQACLALAIVITSAAKLLTAQVTTTQRVQVIKPATPGAPTVSPQGTTGATTYGYRISATDSLGETLASTTGTTTTGNATLSMTNFNRLTWTAITNATGYKVYGRTSGSELFIASTAATTYDDTGAITPTGTPPTTDSSGGDIFAGGPSRLGEGGTPLGAPPSAPTVATNGAGSLNGTYNYGYTEVDGTGESSASPVATISPANNTVRVTVPAPRRGTSSRRLYRTVAGGSQVKLLHDFGGGSEYFQTLWDDNAADGTLGANAPGSDASGLYTLEFNPGVKFFRTHPNQGSGAADVTVLTGNGNVAGAYSMDIYGEIFARSYKGNNIGLQKTGENGNFLQGFWLPDLDDGSGTSGTSVFYIAPRGNFALTPYQVPDQTVPFYLNHTFPTVATGANYGILANFTGAGSSNSAFNGIATVINSGYTGSADSNTIWSRNLTASSGASYGYNSNATGASAQNIGIAGIAQSGTHNIGVYGTSAGQSPSALNLTAAIVASNGQNTDDLFVGLCYVSGAETPCFKVKNGGNMDLIGTGTTSVFNVTATSGGGNVFMKANAGNDVEIGSSNNVPVQIWTNNVNRWAFDTSGNLAPSTTAVTLSANQILGSGTAPTISSGFGTSPSIAGKDIGGRVTVGTTPGTSGVINFGRTWPNSNAPSCTCNNETSAQSCRATPTSTQLTLTAIGGNFTASDKLSWICVGF